MKKNIWIILLGIVIALAGLQQFAGKNFESSSMPASEKSDERDQSVQTDKLEVEISNSQNSKSSPHATGQKSDGISAKPQNIWSKEDIAEIVKRRSNAKFALAAVYTGMAAFHAEYNRYTTDLKSLGFMPMQNEVPYKMGFLKQFQPQGEPISAANEDWSSTANMSTDGFIGQPTDKPGQVFAYVGALNSVSLENYSKYCERGCTATEGEFEILIVFPLPGSEKVDVWVINEKKEIIQVLDGTK